MAECACSMKSLKDTASLHPGQTEKVCGPPGAITNSLAGCRYVERPLLVSGRKFHIRTYVLCLGSLSVYVFNEALALFAGEPYKG